MRSTHLIGGLFVLIMVAACTVHGAEVSDRRYYEDFSTREYCDLENTTALWDTISGELKLHPIEITLTGAYNTIGTAYGVVASGNRAYVADWTNGLVVLDISDLSSPSLLATCDTPGSAFGLAVAGNYAYVADKAYGLQIIDITNPASPSIVGSYNTAGDANAVVIEGGHAFVADGTNGLVIVDVSDPSSPAYVGGYNTAGTAYGVAVDGDYAYVADGSAGLVSVDISDLSSPAYASVYNTAGYAWDVAVAGNMAYVSDEVNGIVVIDIKKPTKLDIEGSIATPASALGIEVNGDILYASCYTAGLLVVDVRDPAAPVIKNEYNTSGSAYDVVICGESVCVADAAAGMKVLQVRKLTYVMERMQTIASAGDCYDAELCGDIAYVVDEGYGLRVIDISAPWNISEVAGCGIPGSPRCIEVAGDYAYIGEYDHDLMIVDVSDPMNPSLVDSCSVPGYVYDMTVSGDYIYIANDASGVRVVDISDPPNPVLVGIYDPAEDVRSVAVDGNLLFAGTTGSILILDVSDPTSPSLVGSVASSEIVALAPSGDYLFAGGNAFLIYDIHDPSAPFYVTGYGVSTNDIAVSGNLAFAACYDRILIFDVSDPTDWECVTSYPQSSGLSIHTVGDHIFTTGYYGFRVHYAFESNYLTSLLDNLALSTVLDGQDSTIVAVRLNPSSTPPDYFDWYVTGNGDFSSITADGRYHLIDSWAAGTDLWWRARLGYSVYTPDINPTCTSLEVEWLYDCADIDSIRDIPNDQGRQVRIEWARSGYDCSESTYPIAEYAVYRKIDYSMTALQDVSDPVRVVSDGISADGNPSSALAYPPGDWDYVTTVPADCEDSYAVVVPTLADSTIDEGMYYTTFFVRARTATPGVYFDSPVDSGYSVDNLAPGVPTGFMVAYNTGGGTELVWDECPDSDFQYFRVYRDTEEGFEPTPENLVQMTAFPAWIDPIGDGWRYSYKITAVDFNGNESEAASAGTVTGDETPPVPTAFALHQNVPNPFNPSTRIRFDLPRAAHVVLHIYDVSGRLVRALVDAEMDTGSKEISWDGRDGGGKQVASGFYFYRLAAGRFVQTRKMVLLR